MYCKNCGKEIAAGAKFCMQCGTPVEDVPEPVDGSRGACSGGSQNGDTCGSAA